MGVTESHAPKDLAGKREAKENKRKPPRQALYRLADFLNAKLKRNDLCNFDNEIQDEIRTLLTPVVSPVSPSHVDQCGRSLETLVRRINRLDFKFRWESFPAGHLRHRGKVLKVGQTSWVVEERLAVADPSGRDIYADIASFLVSGEFSRLRLCPYCQKFFVAKQLRQKFCTHRCKDKFHNKQRLESGYFRENRHKKRKPKLKRACTLLREGKPMEDVVKETGLSLRILRRAGLVD